MTIPRWAASPTAVPAPARTIAVGEVAARATLGRRLSGRFSSTSKGYARDQGHPAPQANGAPAGISGTAPAVAAVMATAVIATAFGGPEVLSLVEVPVEQPGPGHVLVQVRAAGVNPVDYKLYSGAYGAEPSRLPMRLGFEASGVVRGLGA